MARKPKVVLDTNIYISALLTAGTSREIKDLALAGSFEVFVSLFILNEIDKVLTQKIGYPEERAKEEIEDIVKLTTMVDIPYELKIVSDPKDNPVMETALKAKADFLVTNDNKILNLKEYQGVKIKTAAEFLKLLKRGRS